MADTLIERNAARALNAAIIAPRARHEIKPEVEAGRVSLYGRAELTSTGEQARAELERTPGVVEVADHMLYDELLNDQVERAMAEKGLGYINVFFEHGLIVLAGAVPDNATLHKARDIALRIPGVRGVVTNNLLVQPPDPKPAPAAEQAEVTPARS
jgi:osmotically-inducible protein OsmY